MKQGTKVEWFDGMNKHKGTVSRATEKTLWIAEGNETVKATYRKLYDAFRIVGFNSRACSYGCVSAVKLEKEDIRKVYEELKNRVIHPSGEFDKTGRFYAENSDIINVRQPSRAYPYSQMKACRTLTYVKKVAEKYNVQTIEDLRVFV